MTDPARRPRPVTGKTPAPAPRPAAAPVRPTGKTPAPPPATRRPAAAPAPAPIPVEDDEPAPVRRSPVRRGPAESQELDPTTKKGLIAAGVLVVVAAVVWTIVHNKQAAEEEARQAVIKMVTDFKTDIEKVLNDEHADSAAIQAAIDRIDHEQDKWKDHSTESEIMSDRSRLVGKLEKNRLRAEYYDKFNKAKDAVEHSEAHTTKELRDTKLTLNELELNCDTYDPAHGAMIKDWKVKLDHLLVGKMRDEAKAFCAQSSTTPHQGLAAYAEAEDYVVAALIAAVKAKNKADEEAYKETYRALIAESDEYASKVITADFKNSIPWKDLLSGDMVARWSKSGSVPGFAVRIDNGVLTVNPPDPGSKQQGVAGIFDQRSDNLRNFALDMEFSVEGVVTVFFHVSPSPAPPDNRQSMTYDLVAKADGLKAGKKYNMVASFIGSDLRLEFPPIGDEDPIQAYEADRALMKLRKGGIAFLIPEGARLKVTRMRIKELR